MFVPLTPSIAKNKGYTFYSLELSMILHTLGYKHKWGVMSDIGWVMAVKVNNDGTSMTYFFKASDAMARISTVELRPSGDHIKGKMTIVKNGQAVDPSEIISFDGANALPHLKTSYTQSFADAYMCSDKGQTDKTKQFFSLPYWEVSTTYNNWAMLVGNIEPPPSFKHARTDMTTTAGAALYKEILSSYLKSGFSEKCLNGSAFVSRPSKYYLGSFSDGNVDDYAFYFEGLSIHRKEDLPKVRIMDAPTCRCNAWRACTFGAIMSTHKFSCLVPPMALNTITGITTMLCWLIERTFPGDIVFLILGAHGSRLETPLPGGGKAGHEEYAMMSNNYDLGSSSSSFYSKFKYMDEMRTRSSSNYSRLNKKFFKGMMKAFMPGVCTFFYTNACYGLQDLEKGDYHEESESKKKSGSTESSAVSSMAAEGNYRTYPGYTIYKRDVSYLDDENKLQHTQEYTFHSKQLAGVGTPEWGNKITAKEAEALPGKLTSVENRFFAMLGNVGNVVNYCYTTVVFDYGSYMRISNYGAIGDPCSKAMMVEFQKGPQSFYTAFQAAKYISKDYKENYIHMFEKMINFYIKKRPRTAEDLIKINKANEVRNAAKGCGRQEPQLIYGTPEILKVKF